MKTKFGLLRFGIVLSVLVIACGYVHAGVSAGTSSPPATLQPRFIYASDGILDGTAVFASQADPMTKRRGHRPPSPTVTKTPTPTRTPIATATAQRTSTPKVTAPATPTATATVRIT